MAVVIQQNTKSCEASSSIEAAAKLNCWPAPAKINRFLHVLARREDGYHDLQTVFQFLDYGDELSFDLNTQGLVRRSYDLGFSEESDLCLRAVRILLPYAHPGAGVTVHLTKRLPMGGGLGGGSSDAATVLLALNHLWQIGMSKQKLADLGLCLGADVPVFVMGHSAWAEGVGERLTPLKLPDQWFLVANPAVEVSTVKIFSNKRLTPRPQMMRIRAFQKANILHFGENHLEAIVRDEYPQVEELFRWLNKFGEPRMSGSGGAVFLPVDSQRHGLSILENLPPSSTGFVAKGVNSHPLL